ncbi:hypothetical protein A45J_0410 [hot springs metagenome]|uniref:Uncharacterized protein n=1 Tax=hot springs metagenome TaxID=433727 RepID=A0A5J4L066_9ZZZZ
MAKIKFERTSAPTGSVQFSRNPSRGDYQRSRQYLQPMDYADGGDIYIYDKGIVKNYMTLHWRNISKTDFDSFFSFLTNVSIGSKNNFIFTDYDGSTYTARIINSDDIQSSPVMTDRESLTVKLLIES